MRFIGYFCRYTKKGLFYFKKHRKLCWIDITCSREF